MKESFEANIDKLIVLAVLSAFALSAVRGAQFSQHVVDWALGALGVLIVQRFQKPPSSPAV